MTASAMSAPQRNTMRIATARDELRAEDVGPIVFLGRNMTIYQDGVANDSDVEDISADVAKLGV